MEPLAHLMVGGCLGESGLKRQTPLAMAALVAGSMLPDVEGVCYLAGADVAFYYRRGLTHGVLALVVLPLALTGLLLLYDRLWRRSRHPGALPAKPGRLLALSFLAVASHPFLDWLNNYGVRLLMPFSGHWFYGDTLFIVDPWIWIVAGAAVVLTASRRHALTALWFAIGLATSVLILRNALVPFPSRVFWSVAVVAIVLARARTRQPLGIRTAGVALGLTGLYIALMFAGSRVAERQARAFGEGQGWTISQAVSVPVATNPFSREVIVETPDRYFFVRVDWPSGPAEASPAGSLPRREPDEVVRAALGSPSVRGVRGWLRFPSYEVRSRDGGGFRVLIRDARFAVGRLPGYGIVATVDLDPQLRPI